MSELIIRGQREHWQTPVCEYPWLNLKELQDNSRGLQVEVLYVVDDLSQYYKFHWQGHCYAYRSTYSVDYVAWDLDPNESEWHNTYKVLNSGWIADLEKNQDTNYDFPKLQHFVLCTSDYVIEVLSEEEPLIQHWVAPSDKPPTKEKSEFVLTVPEPRYFFVDTDESNFYNTLKNLPEVTNITTYGKRTRKERNEVVLSLSCQFLCDNSLRAVIGLLARYKLPMSSLLNQRSHHNDAWFNDSRAYWYKAVFGHLTTKNPDET